MEKTSRNNPCPCGSGKKYKKCCLNKKPYENAVFVASSDPLHGFDFDKEGMAVNGLTLDDRLIKPVITYSQTHYANDSGKEKVIARIQDKVILNEKELMRYLSSVFDVIIAIDTNTKVIGSESISATGIIHCVLQPMSKPDTYYADFTWQRVMLFRNCPNELSAEKFGWVTEIQRINRIPHSKLSRFVIITDHDLDSHASYNAQRVPIFKDFQLPDNFTLMYGRSDGPNLNLLNSPVKKCDKEANNILRILEQNGYCQYGDKKYSIDQIPVPKL